MKRIFLLLAVVGMTAFQSCSSDDDVVLTDNDTIAEVFEINQDTNFTAANSYQISYDLNPQIYSSDMVLLYRLKSVSGTDFWEPLPKTYYFSDGGELEYLFNFSVSRINIEIDSNFDVATEPAFSVNQVFRVVVIPGYLSNKGASSSVDLSDYKAVVKAYGLNESNIKTLQPAK